MHRTAFTRTQRWARRTHARHLRARALENWLPGYGAAGRRAHSDRHSGLHSRCYHRARRRSLIYGTRSGLGHNHARSRRLWPGQRRRGDGTRNRGSLGRRRHRYRRWSRRRQYGRRRSRNARWRYCRRRGRSNGRPFRGRHGRNHSGPRRGWRRRNWWRRNRPCRSCHRRHHYWCGYGRGLCGHRRNRRSRRGRYHFLLLRDGSEHISRPGDVGQVNLGLDFFLAARWARRLGGWRRSFRRSTQADSDLFRLEVFE